LKFAKDGRGDRHLPGAIALASATTQVVRAEDCNRTWIFSISADGYAELQETRESVHESQVHFYAFLTVFVPSWTMNVGIFYHLGRTGSQAGIAGERRQIA